MNYVHANQTQVSEAVEQQELLLEPSMLWLLAVLVLNMALLAL